MNRKQRRASKAMASTVEEVRSKMRGVMDGIVARLGREQGFVLVVAPDGTEFLTMENVATGTNMPREQASQLMSGIIDYWRGQNIEHAIPDTGTVQVIREIVPMVLDSDSSDAQIARGAAARAAELDALILDESKHEHQRAAEVLAVACELIALSERLKRSARLKPVPPPLPEPREWPPGDTKTTLVADLEAKPQTPLRDRLIAEAKAGRFNDFDSEEAGPKLHLYGELYAAGYPDLAAKTRDGGYDDERPTVEQTEEMRAELGPKLWDAMMSDGPDKRGKS